MRLTVTYFNFVRTSWFKFKMWLYLCFLFLMHFGAISALHAYQINDPRTWFNADQTWIQIVTAPQQPVNFKQTYEYFQLDVADLLASGFPESFVPESQLKLYKDGVEIPIEIQKNTFGELQSGDKIRFLGQRNNGKKEKWAYGNSGADQASTYNSVYSDSSYYWLTWSSSPGKRYQVVSNAPSGTFHIGFRDTLYRESETQAYYRGYDAGAELATIGESEGFYWYDLDLAGKSSAEVTFTDVITDIVRVDSTIHFEARMTSQSIGTRTLQTELYHSISGSIAYHTIGSNRWSGRGGVIATAAVQPVRLVDYNQMQFIFRDRKSVV